MNLGKILCKIGWHKWSTTYWIGNGYSLYKTCERCKDTTYVINNKTYHEIGSRVLNEEIGKIIRR